MSKRIHTDLIKGLGEEGGKDFTLKYDNAQEVLKRIRSVLQKEIEASYIDEESIDQELPINLAKSLGYRRGLREAIKYLPE